VRFGSAGLAHIKGQSNACLNLPLSASELLPGRCMFPGTCLNSVPFWHELAVKAQSISHKILLQTAEADRLKL
jgi:hypothetical protein